MTYMFTVRFRQFGPILTNSLNLKIHFQGKAYPGRPYLLKEDPERS